MNTSLGYSKKTLTNSNVLLSGGGDKALSEFIGSLNWDSTNKKLQYKSASSTNFTDLITFGSNAFNSTSYLPLSGGTLSGDLTIKAGLNLKTKSSSSLENPNLDLSIRAFGYKSSDDTVISWKFYSWLGTNENPAGIGYMPIVFGAAHPNYNGLVFTGTNSYSGTTYSNYWGINTSNPQYLLDVNGSINGTSIYLNGTALGTASTHAHGDYVTAIGTNGNTLTWSKGGTAQTAITVPYATNADKVDGYHANAIENIYYGAWCVGANSGTYYGKVAEFKLVGTGTVDVSATFLISKYTSSNIAGSVNILNVKARGDNVSNVTCKATWALCTDSTIPITITSISNDNTYYIRIYFKSTGWGPTYGCKLLNSHKWTTPTITSWTLYTGLKLSSTTIQYFTDIPVSETVIPISVSNIGVINNATTIGSDLTTIATVSGVDITAKIGSYAASDHTHSVKINGSTKTIAAPEGTAVDLGSYLPLAGGTMAGNIVLGTNSIIFGQSPSSTWNVGANSGIQILNTVGASATGAPGSYYSGLSVSGYYGFQLAAYGDGGSLLFRNTERNDFTSGWVTIIDSSTIGSQSVNYANSAGNADTLDGYHASNLKTVIRNSKLLTVASSGAGWYRILDCTNSSMTFLITFYGGYNHCPPTPVTFLVSHSYNTTTISQIGKCAYTGWITSLRAVHHDTYKFYIDVYFAVSGGSSAGNTVAFEVTPLDDRYTSYTLIDYTKQSTGDGDAKCNTSTNFNVDYASSAGNADTLDGYHASDIARFYLSPMTSGAPADSAKSWFINTMPSDSGAIVYNVPGSEKTIIAGKSSSSCGHMLQLNYEDTYLRILRYMAGSWQSTDWEKISAGYADSAGSVSWSNVTGGVCNSGQFCFSKTDDHAIQVGNIRGYGSNGQSGEYIHIYERVHIGSPVGWGTRPAPSYGLSTYGGCWLATDIGNVGIGTTSPSTKLHVLGRTLIQSDLGYNISDWVNKALHDGALEIMRTSNAMCLTMGVSNDNYGYIQVKGGGITTPGNLVILPGGGSVHIGNASPVTSYMLNVAGNCAATNFYTTSDARKKQNISIFSEHIRKFQLKDTGKWYYGVIAQEVPEIFRNGEEGNMTVNYNSVLSYYVGVLENKIKQLELKIKYLENK